MSKKIKKGRATGDYEVGYGKPPVATRFRKGQSGNPRGSSCKNEPSHRANQLMLQEAYRPATVKVGDQTIKMPAIAAVFRSLLASGLKGNGPAQRASLRMIEAIEGRQSEQKAELLKAIMDYKFDAIQEIERRRQRGITDVSDFVPRPDDILIDVDEGEVYVKGETNAKDHAILRKLGLKRT